MTLWNWFSLATLWHSRPSGLLAPASLSLLSPLRSHLTGLRGHRKEEQFESVKAEINPRMGKVGLVGPTSVVEAWEEESLVSTAFKELPVLSPVFW